MINLLNKPITLATILLTINKSKFNWNCEDAGMTIELLQDEDFVELATNEMGWAKWNLTKNFNDQSEKTKKFITKLLK